MPINEGVVRDMAGCGFLDDKRDAVLVGGTGKTHLAAAIARSCIRAGRRARFTTVIDLVDRPGGRGSHGRSRTTGVAADPARSPGPRRAGLPAVCRVRGRLLHLISRLHENTSIVATGNLGFSEWPTVFGDAKGPARSSHPHCRIIKTGSDSWRMKNRNRSRPKP